jgi:hypothetical protein
VVRLLILLDVAITLGAAFALSLPSNPALVFEAVVLATLPAAILETSADEYVRNRPLSSDIGILAPSFPAALHGRGAH